jgi:hypothetical protein
MVPPVIAGSACSPLKSCCTGIGYFVDYSNINHAGELFVKYGSVYVSCMSLPMHWYYDRL